MGQVRADEIDGKRVIAIEYTANEALANETVFAIREQAFDNYDLTCMHIYHSLGTVKAGEICLFVFVLSTFIVCINKLIVVLLFHSDKSSDTIQQEAKIWSQDCY